MNTSTAASRFAIPFATDQVLIGGDWRAPDGAQTLGLEDPSEGSELARIARGSAADVDAGVAAARASLDGGAWGRMSAVERGRVLSAIGKKVLENVELLAVLEVHDVGKPLKQARADALALARYCEFYGGAADKVMGDTIPFANGYTAFSVREPHGVTGHIVPWNYPMQIIGRSVAVSAPHSPASAAWAAATAASMSALLPRAISASTLPSLGLCKGRVSPLALAHHWPLISRWRESNPRSCIGLLRCEGVIANRRYQAVASPTTASK